MAENQLNPASRDAAAEAIALSLGETATEVIKTPAAEVVETVDEEIKETPVVKLDATKQVEEEKEFEPFAELYKEEEKPAEKKDEVTSENSEEKYKPYIDKAKEYDETMSIPAVKALAEFFKAGKTDITEFIKDAGLESIDTKTSRQIYEDSLKAEGYNAEAIEAELEEFDSFNTIKQDRLVKPYREQLKKSQEEKLKSFTAGLPQNNKAEVERFETIKKTSMDTLNKEVSDLKGKKYDGILSITEEMIPRIVETAAMYATPKFEDGKVVGYDLKTGIKAAINTLYDKQIKKALIETATTDTFLKWHRKRVNPNPNTESSSLSPAMGDGVKDAIAMAANDRGHR